MNKCLQFLDRGAELAEYLQSKKKKKPGGTPVLGKGIATFTKATEEDRNRNYGEALKLYLQGVELLSSSKCTRFLIILFLDAK